MKRNAKIAGTLALGIVLVAGVFLLRPNAKKVLGISNVEPENVQSVTFYRHLERNEEWFTSDPAIIKYIMRQFDDMVLVPASAGTGGYLSIHFNLKEPMGANISNVVLLGPNLYFVYGNGNISGYKAILGANSADDWDALLAQCEKIK